MHVLIFVLVMFIILFLINMLSRKNNMNTQKLLYLPNEINEMNSPLGICAFDVDGCCLEGQNNTCYYNGKKYDRSNGGCTAAAIKACQDMGYIIAVNTASGRTRNEYYKNVGMIDENGNCVVEEKNWWNNQKYHALENSKNVGPNHGGCGKPYIMKNLNEINGIENRKNAILWDDYYKNIIGAQSSGFGVIAMNNVYTGKHRVGDGIEQNHIDDFINGNHSIINDSKDSFTCNL